MLVCDPVFLLSKEEWHRLSNDAFIYNEKFFCIYILGKKTIDVKRKIKELEKKTGLKAIDIFTRDDPTSEFASPEAFLDIIYKSEFIITDSFHGTAFSIIFEKPF